LDVRKKPIWKTMESNYKLEQTQLDGKQKQSEEKRVTDGKQ
jgi:hypothetical protein